MLPEPELFTGKLLLITVDFWEPSHRFPTGHYVRTIGAVGDTQAESEAILLEHEVNTAPFSAQVQMRSSRAHARTHPRAHP